MSARKCARGFTLIEVLVVVSIIGVLVALLLPAVNATREASRRASCVNNLMQLSIALQNYAGAHNALPPGVVNDTGPILNRPRGYHAGWMVMILPFVEARAVARQVDGATSIYDPANLTARRTTIATFLCPSDPAGVRRPDGIAANNYAACHHDVEKPIGSRDRGVFFLNSRVRHEDVTDGTSCTIFLGEKLRNAFDLGWASGTRASLRNAGSPINGPDLLYGPGPILPWNDNEDGESPPQAIQPASDNTQLVGGFASRHSGGANFAFGDGAVRFLKTSISRTVFRRLAARADGEMIDDQQW
jgi:prepilin-type N-terminal cleavage/methylation domain-containing protein/prepilin-type processing-associated H-X9-DG protein